jgi:ferredoxin
MTVPAPPTQPLAIIGIRACDLAALKLQDRIFLDERFPSPDYQARRRDLFVLAVNCGRAAPTCFCTSMGTGPVVTEGFDLALTELPDGFLLEVGSVRGSQVVTAAPWVPCSTRAVAEAQGIPRKAEREMEQRKYAHDGVPRGRWLDTSGIHDLLLGNLEHPRWMQVAGCCLSCGNCTQVCPTCFCSTVEEVADLTGDHVGRDRFWASCFTAEHSYMNSGTVRKANHARYRQWLTHKLATCIDQFGSSGCVGCGRCITWCPVGIDLTEEVAAIRGGTP